MNCRLMALCLLFVWPLMLSAQNCQDENLDPCNDFIDVSNAQFAYLGGANGDPNGPNGLVNVFDEPIIMSSIINSNGQGQHPNNSWDDFNFEGVIDFGEEQSFGAVYVAVPAGTFGILEMYAGDVNNEVLDAEDAIAFLQIFEQDCPRVYSIPSEKSTQFISIFRREGLGAISELAFCNAPATAPVSISGCVTTPCNVPVSNVTVELTDLNNSNNNQVQTTDAQGCYEFSNLTNGGSFQVAVLKDDEIFCGLDGVDRTKIINHLQGADFLDAPFGLLAGDVNSDNIVDFQDLFDFSDLIQACSVATFEDVGGTDWKFIRTDHTFPNINAPWDIADLNRRDFNNIISDQTDQSFIGVKTGDVDCSYESDCLEPNYLTISGCTATRCGTPVPGAVVTLEEYFFNGIANEITCTATKITDENGCYSFTNLVPGNNYMVSIEKNDQLECGISADDYDVIVDHLLYDAPIDFLIADMNNNQAVTAFDLLLIRMLFLGEFDRFIENGGVGWKFLSDPNKPLSSGTNSYDLQPAAGDELNLNFTAIKTGDFDCTYTADCVPEEIIIGRPEKSGKGGKRNAEYSDDNGTEYSLNAFAQPNPFKHSTSLNVQLPEDGPVRILIYDILGAIIYDQQMELNAGPQLINLDQFPQQVDGILYFQVTQGDHMVSGRMMRLK